MFRYPRVVNRNLKTIWLIRMTDEIFITRSEDKITATLWVGCEENPDSFLLDQPQTFRRTLSHGFSTTS